MSTRATSTGTTRLRVARTVAGLRPLSFLLVRPLLLSLSLLLAAAAVGSHAQDTTCVIADPNQPGNEYNLQPLMADTDYECDNTAYTSYYYKLNVCKAITTTSANCAAGSTGVCELSHSSQSSTYVGGIASTPQLTGSQLTLQYPQGTSSSAIITFTCAAGSGIGNPQYDHETFTGGIRYYYFTWTTEYACSVPEGGAGDGGGGGEGGLSGGSIFLIVLLCLVVVYLAAGIAYNHYRNGETGLNTLPNRDFWREMPYLVKDGCVYTYNKIQDMRNR